jgi:acyl-CoA thioesterase
MSIEKDRFAEKDLFARHVGIELTDMSPGHAAGRLKIQRFHLNGLGLTQGGVVFTLADLVFAAASNAGRPPAVAINSSISIVKATTEGAVLTAVATETSRNAKLATYTVHLTDDAGDMVAIFQGMVYIKKDRKPQPPAV